MTVGDMPHRRHGIPAATLKEWLHDGGEIALLDLREHGQYGDGHPLYAVSLPYSRLEAWIERLVPNRSTRMVLLDSGEMALAERAFELLTRYGYARVHVLEGGAAGWREAGYALFAGVNVLSKAFGELAAELDHVPQISAPDLRARMDRGDNLVVVDGRPRHEYQKMNVPGSICCPVGELVLRIGEIAPDPATTVVVNCAGRTRSIMGAATLRRFGTANPVVALENGTMGWLLAGFALEHGSGRFYPDAPAETATAKLRARASAFAGEHGVTGVPVATVEQWRRDPGRTTYLLDIRTDSEFAEGSWPGAISAPGGQLLQATDEWIGVRHSRLVVADQHRVRSVMIAFWLRQLGWEAHYLDEDLPHDPHYRQEASLADRHLPVLPVLPASEVARLPSRTTLLDLRSSMQFRSGHIARAKWAVRPRLRAAAEGAKGLPIVLIGADPIVVRAAAMDLTEAGCSVVGCNDEDAAAWREAGIEVVATPAEPADRECIDFLFFAHARHDGDLNAARQYLAWELHLLDRLDRNERTAFRLAEARPARAPEAAAGARDGTGTRA